MSPLYCQVLPYFISPLSTSNIFFLCITRVRLQEEWKMELGWVGGRWLSRQQFVNQAEQIQSWDWQGPGDAVHECVGGREFDSACFTWRNMLEVWSYSINTLPLPISPLLIFFSPPFSFFVSLSFLLCAQTHANTRAHFTSLAHSLPSIFFLCHRRTISSRDQCGTETLINIFSLSVPVVLSNNTMASLGMMLNKSVIYRRCSQDM